VAPTSRRESTIENAFDYPANVAKPDSDKTKLKNIGRRAHARPRLRSRDVRERKITGFQDHSSQLAAALAR
jgi:hypothetical protein